MLISSDEKNMLIGLTTLNITVITSDGDTITATREGTSRLYCLRTTLTGEIVEPLASKHVDISSPLNHYYRDIDETDLLDFFKRVGGPDLTFKISFVDFM